MPPAASFPMYQGDASPAHASVQHCCMQGQPFEFEQQSVQLNSFYGASGAISFSGRWRGNGKRYSLTMSPQGNLAQVTALTESVDAALNEQKLNMSAVSAGQHLLRSSKIAATACRQSNFALQVLCGCSFTEYVRVTCLTRCIGVLVRCIVTILVFVL